MGGIVKCRSSDRVNCDGRPPFLRDSLLLTTGIVRQTGSDYSCCWAAVSFSSTGLFSSPVGRTTATRVLRDRQSLARLLYNQLTSFQADARPKVELALSSIAQVSTLRLSIRTNGSLCLSKLPSVYRGRASLRLFPSLDLIRNFLSLSFSLTYWAVDRCATMIRKETNAPGLPSSAISIPAGLFFNLKTDCVCDNGQRF